MRKRKRFLLDSSKKVSVKNALTFLEAKNSFFEFKDASNSLLEFEAKNKSFNFVEASKSNILMWRKPLKLSKYRK